MTFKERIRQTFKEKGLTYREVCSIMDNYSEPLFSRQISEKELNGKVITVLIKYFPDLDYNYLLKGDTINQVSEGSEYYGISGIEIIKEIEEKLNELKCIVSQK